jgi:hypothetical protein
MLTLACCPAAAAAAGRDVYVDIAGWHLFLRDMSAVPGLKMSQALATKLGPEVCYITCYDLLHGSPCQLYVCCWQKPECCTAAVWLPAVTNSSNVVA